MAITFDYEKCSGCGRCYDLCPMDVIGWNKEKNQPTPDYSEDCWFCGSCWLECPDRAIDIQYPCCFW